MGGGGKPDNSQKHDATTRCANLPAKLIIGRRYSSHNLEQTYSGSHKTNGNSPGIATPAHTLSVCPHLHRKSCVLTSCASKMAAICGMTERPKSLARGTRHPGSSMTTRATVHPALTVPVAQSPRRGRRLSVSLAGWSPPATPTTGPRLYICNKSKTNSINGKSIQKPWAHHLVLP